jgi:hypothetical protein
MGGEGWEFGKMIRKMIILGMGGMGEMMTPTLGNSGYGRLAKWAQTKFEQMAAWAAASYLLLRV